MMSTEKSRKEKASKENDLFRDEPSYVNKSLRLSLPIPVSVNHLHFRKRNGKVSLTNRAERYMAESRALINAAVEDQLWLRQEHAVWLYVDMVFYMPDRRIRDSHNCLKLLMDCLQGIVFDNDYYVMPRIQSVELDPSNPRVEVVVTPQRKLDRQRAAKVTAQ